MATMLINGWQEIGIEPGKPVCELLRAELFLSPFHKAMPPLHHLLRQSTVAQQAPIFLSLSLKAMRLSCSSRPASAAKGQRSRCCCPLIPSPQEPGAWRHSPGNSQPQLHPDSLPLAPCLYLGRSLSRSLPVFQAPPPPPSYAPSFSHFQAADSRSSPGSIFGLPALSQSGTYSATPKHNGSELPAPAFSSRSSRSLGSSSTTLQTTQLPPPSLLPGRPQDPRSHRPHLHPCSHPPRPPAGSLKFMDTPCFQQHLDVQQHPDLLTPISLSTSTSATSRPPASASASRVGLGVPPRPPVSLFVPSSSQALAPRPSLSPSIAALSLSLSLHACMHGEVKEG